VREAIAAHIGMTRGLHCSPEQIILTAGAQGALDLVARVLLDPGDLAWVEDPGYSGARGALLAAGAKLVAVPVDREGIEVQTGRQLCPEARLAIVTPSHQFPTGVSMNLSRRLALLEWSRKASAWIVEDDYDSEYRFSGRPLEALQSLDRAGRVLYIGTFSKVLFPSLRLGYLVAPPELLPGLLAARRCGCRLRKLDQVVSLGGDIQKRSSDICHAHRLAIEHQFICSPQLCSTCIHIFWLALFHSCQRENISGVGC
jgi:GntR family transcriptional regulator/MocR family aminotransferase